MRLFNEKSLSRRAARKAAKISARRRGTVLILSLIFLATFAAWAVAIGSVSGTNLQIADKQHKANQARAVAESGFEVMQYCLTRIALPGNTPDSQRFSELANCLTSDPAVTTIFTPEVQASTIFVPQVTLGADGRTFSATLRHIASDYVQLQVTGTSGQMSRILQANYMFDTRAHSVFDFGVATKGPLSLAGNIELDGVNVAVESDVYVETDLSLALSIIGNSHIAGDVHITNAGATVDLQGGQASIGGETGQDAIDNHVTFGAPETEFPAPNPDYFESMVSSWTYIDGTTDTSSDATFDNPRIVAGTNPTFSGSVTLNGVVYIETPNVVTFAGNATVTGIIVGDGDINDDSETNRLDFQGTVDSYPVSELPDEPQFAGLHEETGTFIIAPGFASSFGGTFDTINGAIASNGVQFYGNAGGTINGSILNYSDNDMTFSGNSDLWFNRSGTAKVPAGFIPELVLTYQRHSYTEVVM